MAENAKSNRKKRIRAERYSQKVVRGQTTRVEQRGYHAPTRGAVKAQGTLKHVDTGATPLSEAHMSERKRISGKKAALIVLAIICVLGVFWSVAWFNRNVTFLLNNSSVTTKVGTQLTTLIDTKKIEVTPGNLVSVAGDVLEEGAGDPFSVSIDNQALSYSDAKNYTVQGGENITVSNGANVMENYTIAYEELAPKLQMTGDQGSIMYVSQWPRTGTVEVRTGIISGAVAEGETTNAPQNAIVTLSDIHPANDQKLVALTLSEGPGGYTKNFLDILAAKNVKATFFVLGENVDNNPKTTASIVEQGNQIASLTSSFKVLTAMQPQELQETLMSAFTSIKQTTGIATTLFRPPYGQYDATAWLNSGGVASAAIFWTQEASASTNTTAEAIKNAALQGVQSGSIILLGDGGSNVDVELEALPSIIDALQTQGYTLVTIDELLASDSTIPADIASDSATMPEGCTWPTELAR